MSLRVRNILSNADGESLKALKKMLPKHAVPDVATAKYPAALLSALPKDESYSLLGCITEELLRSSVINFETLCSCVKKWWPDATEETNAKLLKSKTTEPFLDLVRTTKVAMDAVVRGSLRFDTAVSYKGVEGHPDFQTETQLFEVKLTGLLEKNWTDFLLQVYAYGALEPTATDLYLVLPLQQTVWHAPLSTWANRTAYRDLLNTLAERRTDAGAFKSPIPGQALQAKFGIGTHMGKAKTITDTVYGLRGIGSVPIQIFLGPPLSSHFKISDEDIESAAALIKELGTQLYVHSQYIINLCSETASELLIKNLTYATRIGCRGVVVHVGKSTGQALPMAMATMRANLELAIPFATETCPILLETPAGQGTETLTEFEDFVGFVASFADNRLRICVDTCHVFATGYDPADYIEGIVSEHKEYLKLVHFNDSNGTCGCCKDRHAFIGTGDIGLEALTKVAELCSANQLPMVVE